MMLKKSGIIFITLFLIYSCRGSSKSFFRPRDISTDSALELSLTNHHRYHSLDAEWFYLYFKPFFMGSTQASVPERKVAGMLFTLYGNITQSVWVGINTAAMHVSADARRIISSKCSIGGLDDIQFKLGYDLLKNDESHAGLYLVATAPTGKRPNSRYLFEPLVGSKNGSFGLGLNTEMPVCDFQDKTCALMFDVKYRYVFSAQERHCFDILTVTPRGTVDLWAAITLPVGNVIIELGYDFWWRQTERVCRKCSLGPRYVIPKAQSQKLYLDLGYTLAGTRWAPLIGLGVSYEFATKHALRQWGTWLTAGLSY